MVNLFICGHKGMFYNLKLHVMLNCKNKISPNVIFVFGLRIPSTKIGEYYEVGQVLLEPLVIFGFTKKNPFIFKIKMMVHLISIACYNTFITFLKIISKYVVCLC